MIGQRSATVGRLFEVLAAFVATAIVTLYAAVFHPLNVYVPLVAGVIQLLPGLQLTSALHVAPSITATVSLPLAT